MNHVGELINKELKRSDTVLDIGCGIMQGTMDTWQYNDDSCLKCRTVTGLDAHAPYLDRIKHIPGVTVITGVATDLSMFVDKSFDVVIALDLIEHLTTDEARQLLLEMTRIARRKVIIYTPSYFYLNERKGLNCMYGEWGLNHYQDHKCFLEKEVYEAAGYTVRELEPHRSFYIVKNMNYEYPRYDYSLYLKITRKRWVRRVWRYLGIVPGSRQIVKPILFALKKDSTTRGGET